MELRQNGTGGLSASWLKYFACVFMFIDHLAHVWNPFVTPETAGTFTFWGNTMYYLGRLAFPIFVFFVAEGCRKTHDMGRYLLRLGAFAAVAQLPFSLLFPWAGGSIMLTFFLGALGVFCYQKLLGRIPAPAALLPAAFFALVAEWLNSDYSWLGVLLVMTLYLCGDSRKAQLLCLGTGLAIFYLVRSPLGYLSNWILPGSPFLPALARVLPRYLQMYLSFHLATVCCALLSLIPLYFYNGQRGKGSKWFFYWFYPAHLLGLWGLRLLIS